MLPHMLRTCIPLLITLKPFLAACTLDGFIQTFRISQQRENQMSLHIQPLKQSNSCQKNSLQLFGREAAFGLCHLMTSVLGYAMDVQNASIWDRAAACLSCTSFLGSQIPFDHLFPLPSILCPFLHSGHRPIPFRLPILREKTV